MEGSSSSGSRAGSGSEDEEDFTAEVRLEDSLRFLDRRLLALGWQELRPLFLHLHRVAESTTALRDLAAECKVNDVSLSAPLQLKVNKIHDAVHEHLPVLSLAPPLHLHSEQPLTSHNTRTHLAVHSCLPSRQYLLSFAQRLKTRCKPIEEMLSSKKLDNCRFRFSGKLSLCSRMRKQKNFDISLLRREIQSLQRLLETLHLVVGEEKGRFDAILQYFDRVKQELHWPWQEIVLQAAQLPELQQSESALHSQAESFRESEARYLLAREHEALVSAAALREEKRDVLCELCALVREQLPCREMRLSLQAIASLLNEEERNIMKEVLLIEEKKQEDVAPILLQRDNAQIESALRAYAQAVMRTYKYNPSVSLESAENDEFAWIRLVESFDWGRWLGLAQLWRELAQQLQDLSQTEEVLEATESLQRTTESYQRTGSLFQNALREYHTQLMKHVQLMNLMQDYRQHFEEFVANELHLKITLI